MRTPFSVASRICSIFMDPVSTASFVNLYLSWRTISITPIVDVGFCWGSIFLQLASRRKHGSKFGYLPGIMKFLDLSSSCGSIISSMSGLDVYFSLLVFAGLRYSACWSWVEWAVICFHRWQTFCTLSRVLRSSWRSIISRSSVVPRTVARADASGSRSLPDRQCWRAGSRFEAWFD